MIGFTSPTRFEYYNEELIKSAISFEVGRGGQVYFIHNDINSIKSEISEIKTMLKILIEGKNHGW